MTTALAVVTAAVFPWPGTVSAIPFVEAPLKFRAPNLAPAIGPGIGRPDFRARNSIEILFAAAVLVAIVAGPPDSRAIVALIAATAALMVQMIGVRLRSARRGNAVLAGHDAPRSHGHHAYVGPEALKVAAPPTGGILVLTGTLP